MSEHWEPCPRCDSNRVKYMGTGFWLLFGILMMSFGLFLFFLIIPLALVPVGAVMALVSKFLPNYFQCKDCKKTWREKKKKDEALST